MAKQLKILLVEDHPDIRRVMYLLLRNAGYSVDAASSVSEGVRLFTDHSVILLDHFLPDGTGVDVLNHIRASGSTARVAFVTAAFDLSFADSFLTADDKIFQKPVNFKSMFDWIGNIV
jgi:CheY-like chemotaxis protein